MRKILVISASLLVILLLILPVSAQSQEIYFITIIFDRGEVKIKDVSKGNGYPSDEEKNLVMPYYLIELLSMSGEVLESINFNIHLEIAGAPPLSGEENISLPPLEQTEELITIPFYSDGKILNLYDANHYLIDSKDVGYLAPEECGNNKCELHENFENCTQDCPAIGKDSYCNLEKVNEDPDCASMLEAQKLASQNNVNKKIETIFNKYLLAIIIGGLMFLALIIIAIIFYIKRKKENGGMEYSNPDNKQ